MRKQGSKEGLPALVLDASDLSTHEAKLDKVKFGNKNGVVFADYQVSKGRAPHSRPRGAPILTRPLPGLCAASFTRRPPRGSACERYDDALRRVFPFRLIFPLCDTACATRPPAVAAFAAGCCRTSTSPSAHSLESVSPVVG